MSDDSLHLILFHTNDHHGHYLKDKRGQYGMAARKTLLNIERKKAKSLGAKTLLLSGGDINTGTMESDIFKAEPDFKGMNKLGYDAMAVGNHEFDNSYKTILKQQKWGGFPFLSANIYWKKNNKRVFDKPLYIVKKFGKFKIGILGLTTTDTPFKASHLDAKKLFSFKEPAKEAQKVIDILRQKEKVDFVIALTHMGHHGSDTSQGDIDLAQKTTGLDIIIGGHSQEIIKAERVKETVVVQAQEWGKYLGRLSLKITKNGWEVLGHRLIPVNLKKKVDRKYEHIETPIPEDKKMLKLFSPFVAKIDELTKKVIGKLNGSLSGERVAVRSRPMGLGQLLGTAMIEKANVDVAITNGGGLRSTLPAGKVTRKELHAVYPYVDTIIAPKLTAKEFYDYVQNISKYLTAGVKASIGGYPHFVGMRVTFSKTGKLLKIESHDKRWKVYLDKSGKVQGTKKYVRFAISGFLANGGDNYPNLRDHKGFLDTGFFMSTVLESYFEKNPAIYASKFRALASQSIIRLP